MVVSVKACLTTLSFVHTLQRNIGVSPEMRQLPHNMREVAGSIPAVPLRLWELGLVV